MITPLTSSAPSVLPDTVPVSSKNGAPSLQTPSSFQFDKQSASTANQSSKQDTVTLSSTALDMSKSLNVQHEQKAVLSKQAEKQQELAVAEEKTAYKASVKNYPPFMGNSEELKMLKQSSPALYREILRMIVPPPLDISVTDLQMLQSGNVDSSTTTKVG